MFRHYFLSVICSIILLTCSTSLHAQNAPHVWQLQEIEFHAAQHYANPYVDVQLWIDLKGPGFSRRVYGFWDDGDVFRVRFVATAPGKWSWTSASNQPNDKGLNGKSGSFTAQDWSAEEKRENPTRRGFIRATANGHALEYADGTPFFLIGDTWLGAATWRLPLTGQPAPADYEPSPGITFEQAVAWRKRQGYNSVSMIAAFPTWATDQFPATYADHNGVFLRNAWEEFGVLVDGKPTAKAMHDERGYRPFEIIPNHEGRPDFDRIVPQYFQSLDKKMRYLNAQGFIPILETIRRDTGPAWKAYSKNFDESYSRFVEYMAARYGAYNFIFSKIHFDIYLKNLSLTADEFNQALNYHYRKFGPMPFGQPVTSLIDHSTYTTFGAGSKAPWITLQSVGNEPRDNRISAALEDLFRLNPPYPALDMEPYFSGWLHPNNVVAGEQPQPNTDRDNYFARAQMYGCVLSGGLAGHVYGTGAYDLTRASEPEGSRPYFWKAMQYKSGGDMQWLSKFVLSEGKKYRDLLLATDDLAPNKAEGSKENGLDGWAFLMRTKDKNFGLLYFENEAQRAHTAGWNVNATYRFTWYNPRTGEWLQSAILTANAKGEMQLPSFPGDIDTADTDWAAKIVSVE